MYDDPRPVPHDLEAEDALLGAMLLSREAIRDVAPLVHYSDFYRPGNQYLFDAVLELDGRGERADTVAVADLLRTRGTLETVGGVEHLHRLQNESPTISNAERYAAIIVRHSRLRALVMAASAVTEAALDGTDPDVVLDKASALLRDWRLLPRGGAVPAGLARMRDFLAELHEVDEAGETVEREWIVPGLLRAGWRIVMVGGEGSGKSTLLRSISAAVANGIHPFVRSIPVPPQITLTVDAENPVDVIDHQARLIDECAGVRLSECGDWWLWHCEAGMDLTRRADQARFEQVLELVRPRLVTMGPAYKLYPSRVGDDWSSPTLSLLRFLHEVAVRYGFAIIVEHHSPKGSGGQRDLFPAGASEWMRWPEFGLKLTASKDAGKDPQGRPLAYEVGRWRGDRLPAQWPTKLSRSGPSIMGALPWEGTYPDGTF